MKKTYFQPQTLVVTVMTQGMLAFSKLEGQENQNNVSVTLTETEYDGEGAARRSSVWDDAGDEY